MHNTFIFPIECYKRQFVFGNYIIDGEYIVIDHSNAEEMEWSNEDFEQGEVVILKDGNGFTQYNVFDEVDIIPEIISLVNNVLKGRNKNKLILEWVRKWGFPNSDIKQKINEIWNEFYSFYKLWELYKLIANRQYNQLNNFVKFVTPSEEDKIQRVHTLRTSETLPSKLTSIIKAIFFEDEECSEYMYCRFHESEEKPKYLAALAYLAKTLPKRTGNISLESSQAGYELNEDYNQIIFKPRLKFSTLMQAVYMQFYILLNENEKKICPVCNTPFIPERKDKKYCSETCKLTAKSRRYRQRKKTIFAD